MSKIIPIIVEPYPDELLYSWVQRLAKANELSSRLFCETYFENINLDKRSMKIDIRRGYKNFYEALNCDVDMMDLYFQMTTSQFELSFCYERNQIKVLNNILREEDNLNYISNYFIQKPKVCLECMKEDIEKYGECYFHRSHQLSDVNVCYKHHTLLYEVNRKYGNKHQYDYNNLTENNHNVTDFDCKYAEYTYQLLKHGFSSNLDDIDLIISNKIKEQLNVKKLSRQQLAYNIAKLLNDPTKEKTLSKHGSKLSLQEIIKILIEFFPNVNDFINKLPHYDMVIKKHCDICNKDFYTTNQAIKDGWGCIYCDEKMDETKLIKRLVKKIGKNEFDFKRIADGKQKMLILYHKSSAEEFSINFRNFFFTNAKYHCSSLKTKKEAEKRMSKYKHFKLIEFSGITKPVEIYHDVCGQTFKLSGLDLFLENPTCRCCETRKFYSFEAFKQQVRDLVGDEYEVLEEIESDARNRLVRIKHNKCGETKIYKVKDFIVGARCPNCKQYISKEKMNEMLERYSNGRYTIIGSNNNKNKYRILDQKTNQEKQLMPKYLLQEILRPTPSPIFELRKDEEIIPMKSWDVWYELCKEYRNEFGHLCVKNDEKYKGKLIGAYCKFQRRLYNKGELSEEKIQKFKEIDFVFDTIFYKWNKRFEEYKEFVKDTGILIPNKMTIYKEHTVGRWVSTQRAMKTKGELNPVYEKLLLEFNPDFFKKLN